MKQRYFTSAIILALVVLLAGSVHTAEKDTTRIHLGYFEGGKYPLHDQVRQELQRQLDAVVPDHFQMVFVPTGFRSADWNRDSCRIMARQLAGMTSLDAIVTMGPWAVEDLLEAGCKTPIIAMYRFDPVAEKLVDRTGRPIAENLSLCIIPNRLENDLNMISRLFHPRRVGFLYFPSSDESERVVARASSLGQQLGFEVVSAEGFDNKGTYAFFNAYKALDGRIDVLYLPPLWGMDIHKAKGFIARITDSRVATFTSEIGFFVDRRATAADGGQTFVPEARHAALNLLRIIRGATPSSLPTILNRASGLSLNLESAATCNVEFSQAAINQARTVGAPVDEEAIHYRLLDVTSRAVERNPGYLAVYDALEAVSHAAKQANSDYLPHISAQGRLTHFDDNSIANSGATIDQNSLTASVSIYQQLFSLQTIRKIQQAAEQKNLSRADLDQARLDMELAVCQAYLNYLQATDAISIWAQHRTLVDRSLEIAHTRFILDEEDKTDFLRWENERSRATMALVVARADRQIAAVLLNVLLNLPGDLPFTVDADQFADARFRRQFEQLRAYTNTESDRRAFLSFLVERAGADNIGLRRHQSRMKLGLARLSESSSRYYPTIGFRASLNFKDELADSPIFEEHKTWSASGFVSIPLFEGADRIHEKRKLRSQLSREEYLRDRTSLDVMGKIRTSASRMISNAVNVPHAVHSQELARESYELIAPKFESGKATTTDLLRSLSSLRESEFAYIATRYDYFRQLSELVHNLGWIMTDHNATFDEEFYRRVEQQYRP